MDSDSRTETGGPTSSILDAYVMSRPTSQNIVDIFQGEWSSMMPEAAGAVSEPGFADVFNDPKVAWAEEMLGGFSAQDVVEFGPLEGGHSYMLQQRNARRVVAIEANTRAFLKCLCVKEILGLDRVSFLLGDFLEPLGQHERRYDIALASGVLYHMEDPMRLLVRLSELADRVFIWTHYFDQEILTEKYPGKFEEPTEATYGDFVYTASRQSYEAALEWNGFCGGAAPQSLWFTRQSLIDALRFVGYSNVVEGFDAPDHPHGPSLALCAWR